MRGKRAKILRKISRFSSDPKAFYKTLKRIWAKTKRLPVMRRTS